MIFLSRLYVNRLILVRAGKGRSVFAVVRHVGRSSGRKHRNPVLGYKVGKWFIIPLPYGDGTQWCRNVFAASGCVIEWRGNAFTASDPRLLTSDVVNQRLARWQRMIQGLFGTRTYVM